MTNLALGCEISFVDLIAEGFLIFYAGLIYADLATACDRENPVLILGSNYEGCVLWGSVFWGLKAEGSVDEGSTASEKDYQDDHLFL